MAEQAPNPGSGGESDDGTPSAIVLGDAAELTRGGDDQSVENKQNPYD